MGSRQHGERRDPLRPAIGDDPGEAAAPIMADQMEPPAAVADASDDVLGIADQFVDPVVIEIGRVGTRAGGVAALVGGHGKVSRRGQHRDLVVPEIARYTEAVQHQHKRRRRITADGAVEYQAGSGFNLTRLDHGRHQDFHRSERGGDEITSRRRGSIRLSLGPLPPRQLSISGSPDEVIADRRLAERNPFRGWSSLSVSESFIRSNCHSTHNCGSERPGVLTSSIRADTRNGGQPPPGHRACV
jgi:hypothetical protein